MGGSFIKKQKWRPSWKAKELLAELLLSRKGLRESEQTRNSTWAPIAVGSAKPYINNKWRAEGERSFNLSWNSIYTTPAHLHQNSGAHSHPLMSSWPKRALTPTQLEPEENVGTQIWHLKAGENRVRMVKTALYFLNCLRRVEDGKQQCRGNILYISEQSERTCF